MSKLTTQWGKHQVNLEWVQAAVLPLHLLQDVSSVHGFCFEDDQVYLVNLESRGWDIPGGHVEDGETPLEAFDREAMEEASISGTSEMIGYVLVDNSDDIHYNGKYSMVGVQVFYRMDVKETLPFVYDFEASERTLIPADKVPSTHAAWNTIFQAAFDATLI